MENQHYSTAVKATLLHGILSREQNKHHQKPPLSSYQIVGYILVALSYFIAPHGDAIENWRPWRSNNTVDVSYRDVGQTNLIEIKARLDVDSTLSGFLQFIQDTSNISQWMANTRDSKIIKKLSENEVVFITFFKTMWPVKPRYMTVHSRYWQNPDLSIEIQLKDAPEAIIDNAVKSPKSLRVNIVSAHWLVTPISDKRISVEYQGIADPNGNIPSWLVKKISLNSLWQTLQNIEQQLPNSAWQKSETNGLFIKNKR